VKGNLVARHPAAAVLMRDCEALSGDGRSIAPQSILLCPAPAWQCAADCEQRVAG